MDGIDSLDVEDQKAIGACLELFNRSFRDRDAEVLRDVYTADADWINAFGTKRRGVDAIMEYLRGLFKDEAFTAGSTGGDVDVELRTITADVVLFATSTRITGQLRVDGRELGVRNNHSLHVLQRQGTGQWLMVSSLFMDARDEKTYVERETHS